MSTVTEHVFCFQDGSDFYVENAYEVVKYLVHSPFVVKDFDQHAAQCARDWFIMVWCRDEELTPIFRSN